MYVVIGVLVITGIFYAARLIRDSHYPILVEPSADWEPNVNSLYARRESLFVESDSLKLEADLFIPNGGANQKPAIEFTGGSGDGIYQKYSYGLVMTYILDLF